VDERRVKLERHLKRLAQLYEWDDMDETQYRAKAGETRMQLALLPQNDKVCSFDEVAEIVESLPAALDRATPDQAKQLLAMVVQEVTTEGRTVAEITLRPEATPFFDLERGDLVLAPPDGSGAPSNQQGRGLRGLRVSRSIALWSCVLQCAVPPPCSSVPVTIREWPNSSFGMPHPRQRPRLIYSHVTAAQGRQAAEVLQAALAG
jgi:hypothetical protein